MKNIIILFISVVILTSCNQDRNKVTNLDDYEYYLQYSDNASQAALDEVSFWLKKLDKDSTKISALSQLAAANTEVFNVTGEVKYLNQAETLITKAVNRAAIGKTGLLRSLAHNYITQHKFKEAAQSLDKAYSISKERETVLMIFDVSMELGNYDFAEKSLGSVKNLSDFNYLIRLAKWMDYKGDLDNAITYFEKAVKIAEAGKLKRQLNWSYTNIADYYGHAGAIKKSYTYYLKALEINPNDMYALKKIAWIVFSHEKNSELAYNILNAIKKKYISPDIHLMEIEIASFEGNTYKKTSILEAYFKLLDKENYGDMYNKYSAIIQSEEKGNFYSVLAIAKREIENRPTPQSYDLLAWAYYNKGEYKKALQIVEDHVTGKTYEPEILYHQARIFKATSKNKELRALKKELKDSAFELGPTLTNKINQL